MRSRISVSNLDALKFLKSHLPRGKARRKLLIYLDPPYYNAGEGLYVNYYKDKDHYLLGKYLKQQNNVNWIVSYDDVDRIREIYSEFKAYYIEMRYSAQIKRASNEIIFASKILDIPEGCFQKE